jgi:hypothetical protein
MVLYRTITIKKIESYKCDIGEQLNEISLVIKQITKTFEFLYSDFKKYILNNLIS